MENGFYFHNFSKYHTFCFSAISIQPSLLQTWFISKSANIFSIFLFNLDWQLFFVKFIDK